MSSQSAIALTVFVAIFAAVFSATALVNLVLFPADGSSAPIEPIAEVSADDIVAMVTYAPPSPDAAGDGWSEDQLIQTRPTIDQPLKGGRAALPLSIAPALDELMAAPDALQRLSAPEAHTPPQVIAPVAGAPVTQPEVVTTSDIEYRLVLEDGASTPSVQAPVATDAEAGNVLVAPADPFEPVENTLPATTSTPRPDPRPNPAFPPAAVTVDGTTTPSNAPAAEATTGVGAAVSDTLVSSDVAAPSAHISDDGVNDQPVQVGPAQAEPIVVRSAPLPPPDPAPAPTIVSPEINIVDDILRAAQAELASLIAARRDPVAPLPPPSESDMALPPPAAEGRSPDAEPQGAAAGPVLPGKREPGENAAPTAAMAEEVSITVSNETEADDEQSAASLAPAVSMRPTPRPTPRSESSAPNEEVATTALEPDSKQIATPVIDPVARQPDGLLAVLGNIVAPNSSIRQDTSPKDEAERRDRTPDQIATREITLKLRGIFRISELRWAIVENERGAMDRLTVGDEINGYVISDIGRDYITLSDGTGPIILSLTP